MYFKKIFILTFFILLAPLTAMAEPIINIVDYPQDERYNATNPYFAELVAIDVEKIKVKFLPVNIKSYLNNDGLSSRRDYKKADFDGEGNSISKRRLPPIGRIFKVGKERLKLQLSEVKSNDNIACKGQVIGVEPRSYTAAYFLMASTKGDAAAKLKLQYGDGSSEELYFAPAISDWRTPPLFTEAQFPPTTINTPYKLTKEPAYVALIKVPVSGTKILKAIKLPDIPRVHIFAITLEEGGPVKNCLYEPGLSPKAGHISSGQEKSGESLSPLKISLILKDAPLLE